MCEQKNEVKVTVICMAYNHEKYIRDALDGFVSQKTNFKFEVIVHDDASTDGTPDIIRSYEKMYPDIIKPIFQKVNQSKMGINKYYKFVLPVSQGEFIALCEGDDYWTNPLKLQKQYDYMMIHPNCSLVVHNTKRVYMGSGYKKAFLPKSFDVSGKCEFSADEVIMNHMLFHTSALFFRKRFYSKNEEFIKHHQSYDYLIKSLLATEGDVHYIPEIMSVYRMGTAGSWTQRTFGSSEKYINHNEVAIKALEDLNEYRLFKYNEAIQKNILDRKFAILLRQRNYSAIMMEPYLSIYKRLALKSKLKIWIGKLFPKLYSFLFNNMQ